MSLLTSVVGQFNFTIPPIETDEIRSIGISKRITMEMKSFFIIAISLFTVLPFVDGASVNVYWVYHDEPERMLIASPSQAVGDVKEQIETELGMNLEFANIYSGCIQLPTNHTSKSQKCSFPVVIIKIFRFAITRLFGNFLQIFFR